MKEVDREVTVAFASESRRPTHSGTGDGSGKADDIALRSKSLLRQQATEGVRNVLTRDEITSHIIT